MPRQLQDSFGRVTGITTVASISKGGTGASTAPQAVINLQGIPRSTIDKPNGVAGSDNEGYLLRKYLEGAGIFSGITLEGPLEIAYSESGAPSKPVYFVSNFHSASPPTITFNNATVQNSLSRDGEYFTFTAPLKSTGLTELQMTVNSRVYKLKLSDNRPMKPVILNKKDGLNKSLFFIEGSRFKSLQGSLVGKPNTWTDITHGENTVQIDTTTHSLYIQGWCGDTGIMSIETDGDVLSFPKSLTRLQLSPNYIGPVKIRAANITHGKQTKSTNTLPHNSTDWQVSPVSDFTQLSFQLMDSTVHLTKIPVTLVKGEYFLRCRYNTGTGANKKASDWSDPVKVKVDPELDTLNEYGIITDPVSATNSDFGSAVSVNDQYVAIGSSRDSGTYVNAGSVLLYRKTNFGHTYLNRITSRIENASSLFGDSVYLTDKNKLFVGSPGVGNKGAVYEFNIVDGEAVYVQEIPARTNSKRFGGSVVQKGNLLAIGDPADTTNGLNSGAVHLYERNGTSWTFKRTIYPTTTAAEDNFGVSLAATKDMGHLFIGATSYDINSSMYGKVYVYTKSGIDTFTETLVRDSVLPSPGVRFARSLAYDDHVKKLYVGCEGDNKGSQTTGSVHIFDMVLTPTVTLTYDKSLYPTEGFTQGLFGSSLSISPSGHQLYVGSRGYRLNNLTYGGVYFFS